MISEAVLHVNQEISIYLLTCSICNKKHIGETEQTLNRRCRGHESSMRGDNDNILSRHATRNIIIQLKITQ